MRFKSLLLVTLLMSPIIYADSSTELADKRVSAEQGDAQAQFELGQLYARGQGVIQNHRKALDWYLKAADQGLAEAQYNLGIVYGSGNGVEQDYQAALAWYQKAAEQGLDEAHF